MKDKGNPNVNKNEYNLAANTLAPAIQTDEDNLVAPISLVPNIIVARAIYNRYRQAHIDRIILYTAIKGLIDGNPPYDPEELAEAKLSHIANFNDLYARSMIDKSNLAYWNLLNEAEVLFEFKFVNTPTNQFASDPSALSMAGILSRNLDKVIRSWTDFKPSVNILTDQLVRYGISPAVWGHEKDWRWKVVDINRFFVADQASSVMGNLTQMCVETDYTIQFLFETYTHFKDIKDMDNPWDIEQLSRLLLYYGSKYTKDNKQTYLDPMDIQSMITNGDFGIDTLYTDTIRLVNMLYVEYDGTITHLIFDKNSSSDILFRQEKQYNSLQEGIVIFTASPGAKTIHENIGVGHKLFAPCQALMQLDCSTVDGAKWASTLFISTPAGVNNTADELRFYPGIPTNIGTAQVAQSFMGANLAPITGISQYIKSNLQANIANSGDDPQLPDSSQGTKSSSEARMQRLSRFAVLKNNIAHFYDQFDMLTKNMVSKMLQSTESDPGYAYAKRWKDLCMAEGVPKEVFEVSDVDEWGIPTNMEVKASRVAGDGSTESLILSLEALQAISGDFGPREANEYKKLWITATCGKDFVPAFLQDSGKEDERAGGASLAFLENMSFQRGQSALVSPDNDQRAHISIHFSLGEDIVQQLQQQKIDPIQADEQFGQLVPHLGEHMELAAKSPFMVNFVAGVRDGWNQLQNYANLNRKNAGRMLQAQIKKNQDNQEKEKEAMSDAERKDFIAQKDESRKDFKMQSQEERATRASQVKESALLQRTDADIERKREEAQATTGLKAFETRSKVALSRETLEEAPDSQIRERLQNINGQTIAPYDIE